MHVLGEHREPSGFSCTNTLTVVPPEAGSQRSAASAPSMPVPIQSPTSHSAAWIMALASDASMPRGERSGGALRPANQTHEARLKCMTESPARGRLGQPVGVVKQSGVDPCARRGEGRGVARLAHPSNLTLT